MAFHGFFYGVLLTFPGWSLEKSRAGPQEHSEEPFSAAAWLSHGEGDLEPLQERSGGGWGGV